jgi:predicted ester cyclase
MSSEGKIYARRSLLGAGVAAGLAAVTLLLSRNASGRQRKSLENFPLGRTDENALSADDPSLPRRVRELIRIGNVGIAKEDNAALAAFFHPQFRFHGPSGELNREQLWEYFAACRAAFDDFTVTRQAVVSDGGDYLATRTRFAGVFARTFTGVAEGPLKANGKRFEYRVINIFRYAPSGQLAEEWVQYDTQAFLNQLQ